MFCQRRGNLAGLLAVGGENGNGLGLNVPIGMPTSYYFRQLVDRIRRRTNTDFSWTRAPACRPIHQTLLAYRVALKGHVFSAFERKHSPLQVLCGGSVVQSQAPRATDNSNAVMG